jgi:methionine aminopeptidase
LGIDTFHEEPPYVSEGERTPIEEGMVLAIETPAYTTDAGAIMIETSCTSFRAASSGCTSCRTSSESSSERKQPV